MALDPKQLLVGLDIGGTKCAAVIGESTVDGIAVRGRAEFRTAETPEPHACLIRLTDLARGLLAGATPLAAGVACGGPLDAQAGLVLGPPNLPGWDHVLVSEVVTRQLGCRTRLENDADACALAEWRWGAGRGCQTMAFLTMGTGLGAGLIIDGRLHRGARNLAGELGHWRLAPDGPPGYGKRGSFEGFCAGGGIGRWAQEEGLTQACAGELFAAAAAGDAAALALVERIATRLGEGLALLTDLLDPERIVIGGIFARREALLRPVMERVLAREALRPCPVVPATLGEAVGDLAALAVAPALPSQIAHRLEAAS